MRSARRHPASSLRSGLEQRLADREMDDVLNRIELPLVPVLCAMERAGIAIDTAAMGEIAAKVSEHCEELVARAHELAGGEFALGSPKQLGEVLFERLELPAGRKGKTGYSTDQRVLSRIRHLHEIVPVIEEWRELSKLLSTYLLPFPELLGDDGRLHTTFSQTTAATGRLSANRPNLQNIPVRTEVGRQIRETFIAAGRLQARQRRLLAGRAADPGPPLGRGAPAARLRAGTRHPRGHRGGGARKGRGGADKEERNRAKAVNFGIIYGISSFGLAEQLDISREEAQIYIDTYRGRMPRVAEFIERAIATHASAATR